MSETGNALVHVGARAPARASRRTPALPGPAGALMRFAVSPLGRRAAMAGAAFVAGYELSRRLRGTRVAELAGTAQDLYRAAQGDPQAEGRLGGAWVRQTLTVIYEMVDRDR